MISAVSLALAVLTKGPAYLLLAVVSIVIFLALNRDLGAILRMPLWKMALAYLAVSAPWYIAIYKLHGKAFVDAFFGFHNVNRFMVAEHKTGSQIYYNLPVLLGGFFPWSVFLPFGLYYVCSKAYGRKSSGTAPGEGAPRHYRMGITFVLVWLTVIFGFFTASSTKLPTYIFPSFISAALITGVLLDDFLGGVKAALTGARISYYALAISIPIGAAIAPIIVNHKLPCAMAGAMTSAAFIAFGMLLSLFSFIIKMYRAAIAFVVYSVAVFIIPLNEMVLPSVERYETSREVSKVLSAMMKPEERLGSESNYLAGLAFYTGKFPVDTDKHHVLTTFMNSAERVWLVMKEKNHKQLYDPAINPTYVVPSYIVYMVGKRAVVTNKVPADGRYISMRKRPDELRR
jgi:4-amino-4-deoxy-L-arabinose transferase-like glycosyltransferase